MKRVLFLQVILIFALSFAAVYAQEELSILNTEPLLEWSNTSDKVLEQLSAYQNITCEFVDNEYGQNIYCNGQNGDEIDLYDFYFTYGGEHTLYQLMITAKLPKDADYREILNKAYEAYGFADMDKFTSEITDKSLATYIDQYSVADQTTIRLIGGLPETADSNAEISIVFLDKVFMESEE